MKGDIIVSEGIEYEVVFDGRQELLEGRDTIMSGLWVTKPEPRRYNKTGKFIGQFAKYDKKKGKPDAK